MKSHSNVTAACQGRAGRPGDTETMDGEWMERKSADGYVCVCVSSLGDMAAVAMATMYTVEGSSVGSEAPTAASTTDEDLGSKCVLIANDQRCQASSSSQVRPSSAMKPT